MNSPAYTQSLLKHEPFKDFHSKILGKPSDCIRAAHVFLGQLARHESQTIQHVHILGHLSDSPPVTVFRFDEYSGRIFNSSF